MKHNELLLPEEDRLRLTQLLFDEGIFGIKENPHDYITLKNGRKSPHYIDLRQGITPYELRTDISLAMYDLALARVHKYGKQALKDMYDYLAGTPEAVTSYVPRVADEEEMDLLQPRVLTEKARGNKAPILGRVVMDRHVAAFDDVITDGESKIDAIKVFDHAGLKVVDYFVVVDREEGGAAEVKSSTGIDIVPALPVSEMAIMLAAENSITQTQFDNIREYLGEYGDEGAKTVVAAA